MNEFDTQDLTARLDEWKRTRPRVYTSWYQQWCVDGSFRFWRFSWWDFCLIRIGWELGAGDLEVYLGLLGFHLTVTFVLRKETA